MEFRKQVYLDMIISIHTPRLVVRRSCQKSVSIRFLGRRTCRARKRSRESQTMSSKLRMSPTIRACPVQIHRLYQSVVHTICGLSEHVLSTFSLSLFDQRKIVLAKMNGESITSHKWYIKQFNVLNQHHRLLPAYYCLILLAPPTFLFVSHAGQPATVCLMPGLFQSLQN